MYKKQLLWFSGLAFYVIRYFFYSWNGVEISFLGLDYIKHMKLIIFQDNIFPGLTHLITRRFFFMVHGNSYHF